MMRCGKSCVGFSNTTRVPETSFSGNGVAGELPERQVRQRRGARDHRSGRAKLVCKSRERRAKIVATVSELGHDLLKAPPRRLGVPDVPSPMAPALDAAITPSAP